MSNKSKASKSDKDRIQGLQRWYPRLLLGCAVLGLFGAFTLTVEKFAKLENPDYELSCSINPLLSCEGIIQSDQASAFGFPNPLIGLVSFAILITLAVTLMSGALDAKKLPNWYKSVFAAAVTFGMGFCLWLMYQSFYNLGKLCIYCMLVWTVVSAIFLYSYLWLGTLTKLKGRLKKLHEFVLRNHIGVLVTWYLLVIMTIFFAFRDYFESLV